MKKTLMAMTAATLVGFSGLAQAQTVLTVSSWVPPTHGLSMSPKKNGVMTWRPKHPIAFVATSFPEPSPQRQALLTP